DQERNRTLSLTAPLVIFDRTRNSKHVNYEIVSSLNNLLKGRFWFFHMCAHHDVEV
ncbi:hypothetical protein L9F63_019360, partial [Diploptera punctata]